LQGRDRTWLFGGLEILSPKLLLGKATKNDWEVKFGNIVNLQSGQIVEKRKAQLSWKKFFLQRPSIRLLNKDFQKVVQFEKGWNRD